MIVTSYFGPFLDKDMPNIEEEAIGRLLTVLLRRLGKVENSLMPIATYLAEVGLFGDGRGEGRSWSINHVPEDLDFPVY